MKKRFGFTLAEVLITLGIIGVVAAMTIPTLIQNASSTRFASQFKKTVSTLSQAALMAQAQYDTDYSLLDTKSDSTTAKCRAEALSKGNNTICGLLNNTLTGHSYLGVYGSVPASTTGVDDAMYTITKTTINPTGWLIFALADGSYVGIDPDIENCNLAAGESLDAGILANASENYQPAQGNNPAVGTPGGSLNRCLGFIDANGGALPNREVTCTTGTAAFSPQDPCQISMTGGAMGDVFPIVFHNGTVEPATNAAKMALTRGK